MIDLKVKKSERKKRMEVADAPHDDYPYGLRLHLDSETMHKLGLKLPSVGDHFAIVAVGRVHSASEHRRQGARADRSAEIQLIKAEFTPAKSSATNAVKAALKDV